MVENRLFSVLILRVRLESAVQLEIACPSELEALRLVYQAFKSEKVKEMFNKIKELCLEFLKEFEEGRELLEYVSNIELDDSKVPLSEFMLKYIAIVERLIEDGKNLEGEEAEAYYNGVVMPYIRALGFAIVNSCREPEYLEAVRWLLKLTRHAREAQIYHEISSF